MQKAARSLVATHMILIIFIFQNKKQITIRFEIEELFQKTEVHIKK